MTYVGVGDRMIVEGRVIAGNENSIVLRANGDRYRLTPGPGVRLPLSMGMRIRGEAEITGSTVHYQGTGRLLSYEKV